jgi:hypothetical protein
MPKPVRLSFLFLLGPLVAVACGKPQIVPRAAPGVQVASITVTSPSFSEGTRIPVDHTCDGKESMPELVLSSPPEGTKSLLVLVDDPDAQSGTFTHMIAFNVAPDTHKLPSGTELTGAGEAARFGLNDFQAAHYSGPCPPKGEVHRYRFRVIALDTVLKLPEGAPRAQVDEAIDGHILGEGALMGHFGH